MAHNADLAAGKACCMRRGLRLVVAGLSWAVMSLRNIDANVKGAETYGS